MFDAVGLSGIPMGIVSGGTSYRTVIVSSMTDESLCPIDYPYVYIV
jgi:hypothetical protein